jgi:Ca2+-binding EF-hand superfamily protein
MDIIDALSKCGAPASEAKKILEIANLSRSGCLDYTEWLIASSYRNELLTEENLRFAFDFFDE